MTEVVSPAMKGLLKPLIDKTKEIAMRSVASQILDITEEFPRDKAEQVIALLLAEKLVVAET